MAKWPQPRPIRRSEQAQRVVREAQPRGWGTSLDPRNFHRKATGSPGFVIPAGTATAGDRGRPAQLSRTGPAQQLYLPLLRSEPPVGGGRR